MNVTLEVLSSTFPLLSDRLNVNQPSQTNPYAAPMQQGVASVNSGTASGLWREDNKLVMHKDGRLPDVCVKSGVKTGERLKRKMSWHNPWIALTILAGLLVYVILALVLTKRATIDLPLCETEKAKRRKMLGILWVIGLACLGLFIGGLYFAIDQTFGRGSTLPVPIIILGAVGGIITLIMGQKVAGVVKPTKITDTHVWLKGVHPSILENLPAAQTPA